MFVAVELHHNDYGFYGNKTFPFITNKQLHKFFKLLKNLIPKILLGIEPIPRDYKSDALPKPPSLLSSSNHQFHALTLNEPI